VALLGEAAALLRVEVDVVDVQRCTNQGLDRLGRRTGTLRTAAERARRHLVIVAAVDELLELDVDAHLVVLEGDERDRKTRVAAEPELEGDVQRLRRGTRAGGT